MVRSGCESADRTVRVVQSAHLAATPDGQRAAADEEGLGALPTGLSALTLDRMLPGSGIPFPLPEIGETHSDLSTALVSSSGQGSLLSELGETHSDRFAARGSFERLEFVAFGSSEKRIGSLDGRWSRRVAGVHSFGRSERHHRILRQSSRARKARNRR